MPNYTITIEELIQQLEEARDKFGPHAEVFKRKPFAPDAEAKQLPIVGLNIGYHDGRYCITL